MEIVVSWISHMVIHGDSLTSAPDRIIDYVSCFKPWGMYLNFHIWSPLIFFYRYISLFVLKIIKVYKVKITQRIYTTLKQIIQEAVLHN